MLLNNLSKLILQIELNLVFDDNTKKTGIVKVGDTVKITYRRDYEKHEGIGVIRQITTALNSKNSKNLFINPTILVDFSKNYESQKVRIPVEDILDFEILTKDKYKPPFEEIIIHNLASANIKIEKVYVSYNCMINDFYHMKTGDLVILEEVDPITKICSHSLYEVSDTSFKYVMDIGDTKYTINQSKIELPEKEPDEDKPNNDCDKHGCHHHHHNHEPEVISPVDPEDNPNISSSGGVIVVQGGIEIDIDNPNLSNVVIIDQDNPNL